LHVERVMCDFVCVFSRSRKRRGGALRDKLSRLLARLASSQASRLTRSDLRFIFPKASCRRRSDQFRQPSFFFRRQRVRAERRAGRTTIILIGFKSLHGRCRSPQRAPVLIFSITSFHLLPARIGALFFQFLKFCNLISGDVPALGMTDHRTREPQRSDRNIYSDTDATRVLPASRVAIATLPSPRGASWKATSTRG